MDKFKLAKTKLWKKFRSSSAKEPDLSKLKDHFESPLPNS